MTYPDDLKYTSQHEWVRDLDEGDDVRVGITQYAQDALGDIVYVTLPELGEEVVKGEPCGELESTKSVSDIYAPLSGVIVARNESLDTTPELINSDPYGDGWMIVVRLANPGERDELLSAEAYQKVVENG